MLTPFYAYLICYRVLKAIDDPRAEPVLDTAYAELRRWAARISDAADRQRFIQQVASHQEIAALAERELTLTLQNGARLYTICTLPLGDESRG